MIVKINTTTHFKNVSSSKYKLNYYFFNRFMHKNPT